MRTMPIRPSLQPSNHALRSRTTDSRKARSRETYELLHHVAGLEDVWQLHWSKKAGDSNFAADRIANLDESTAHWIKLSANKDGSFRVFNGRTGKWTDYSARYRRGTH